MVLNYSKVIARKLILGITALSLTIICLVSTTFAWFAKNQNAWTKDFEMDLKGVHGIELSLDGEHFSQDILASDIKEYLLKETNKRLEENNEKTYAKFDDIKFGFTTIVQEDGKIVKDDKNQVLFEYDKIDNYKHSISNTDLTKKTYATKNQDNGYIKFDIFVRATASYQDKRNYKLSMTNATRISSFTSADSDQSLADVKISNKLTTREYDKENNKYLDTYKEYDSGDIVKVDVANAIRLGIYNVDQDDDGNWNYKDFRIFENSNINDLGSAAIEGRDETDPTHFKNNNAMYTYYNNYFVKYPFTEAAVDGEAFNTNIITYDEENNTILPDNDSTVFGTFTYDENKTSYNMVKLEMYLWLEGWDADYFVGIPDNVSIRVDLEFGIDVI